MESKKMQKIASFSVNHDKMTRGMYVSRIDGDVVSYDVRMKLPNGGDYLAQAAMHTLEHLLATYLRNTPAAASVVYVGPMGCRTGFYILLRDDVSRGEALRLVQAAFACAAAFEGDIPGATRPECGNYLEHDLPGARLEAARMVEVLADWSAEKMDYVQ